MTQTFDFENVFLSITGNRPFPWQEALYERFIAGRIPASCNLPTGLGKTSVVAVWLIALATHPEKMPRRLVYVVNRRTVVDQTTNEVERYRDKLASAGLRDALGRLCSAELNSDDSPLALSTLRGQFADNREWSADPARPAVICGTVDMIGSRLLFSGYGCGFKSKPLHAGFLGQDVLLVHDEAHLEPAFQKLLLAIEKEQHEGERTGKLPWPKMRVMELTATSRGEAEAFPNDEEREANEKHPIVRKRLNAVKTILLHENKDQKKLADEIGEIALNHRNSERAVLVFVRKVDDVEKIVAKLKKEERQVQQLTGTLRGLERDRMSDPRRNDGCPIFARFLQQPAADADENERWKTQPAPGTVYLVCTSAGEVGVNMSADHLVCDLSTFECMAQRFGRVNRFGDRGDTRVDIVHPSEFDDDDAYKSRLKATLELLRTLDDGSPVGLGKPDAAARRAAFAPDPVVLPASDILFDGWALTTITGKLPGRPIVEPYLHGISDYDPPQTTIAWRQEVELLTREILEQNELKPEDILDLYPLKPHEELNGPTYGRNKVFEQLEKIAVRDEEREPDSRLSAWVIDQDGSIKIYPLAKLITKDKQNKPSVPLGGRTVLLPPQAGGFSGGLLKGDEPFAKTIEYDVSDHWYADKENKIRRRWRGTSEDAGYKPETKQMRLVTSISIPAPGDDEDAEGWTWLWFTRPKSADDDGSKSSLDATTWDRHTSDVEREAKRLADLLFPNEPKLHTAIVLAARFHDLGKCRSVWQRSIGNYDYPHKRYAKSGRLANGGQLRPREITTYRHELGSLVDLEAESEFVAITDDETKDLIRHLIAVHHGYGRPHFPTDRAFDPERGNADVIAAEVPRRFARLQRKYGRWGLAYLESLLRAADWAASSRPSKTEDGA